MLVLEYTNSQWAGNYLVKEGAKEEKENHIKIL